MRASFTAPAGGGVGGVAGRGRRGYAVPLVTPSRRRGGGSEQENLGRVGLGEVVEMGRGRGRGAGR